MRKLLKRNKEKNKNNKKHFNIRSAIFNFCLFINKLKKQQNITFSIKIYTFYNNYFRANCERFMINKK